MNAGMLGPGWGNGTGIPNNGPVGGTTWFGAQPKPNAMGQSAMGQPPRQGLSQTSMKMNIGSMFGNSPFAQPVHRRYGGGNEASMMSQPLGGGKDAHFIGGGGQGRTRAVITGGYGAEPARPGRIGYRGALQERNRGGLEEFYAKNAQGAISKAGANQVDPYLGTVPRSRDIAANIARIAQTPDEFPGYGGAQKAALMSQYNAASQSGDPRALQQATGAFNSFKDQLNALRSQRANKAVQSGFQPQVLAEGKDEVAKMQNAIPGMQQRAQEAFKAGGGYVDGGVSEDPSADDLPSIPSPQMMPKLASGGDQEAVKPYIVNEEGPEAWHPEGGTPQLMPGKEKMVIFPKDGKVIPHGRTMKMLKEGKIDLPQHAATGAPNAKGSPTIDPDAPPAAFPRRTKMDYVRNLFHALDYKKPQWILQQEQQEAADKAARQAALESFILPSDSEPQMPVADSIPAQPVIPPAPVAAPPPGIAAPPAFTGPIPNPVPITVPTPDQLLTEAKSLKPAKPTDAELEKQLLAEGLAMNARGIKQQGPSGVEFEAGGGIKNGKAYGANVVQPKVNIRPGVIKDERGDVTGPRNSQDWVKKDKARWENEGEEMKALTKQVGRTASYAK